MSLYVQTYAHGRMKGLDCIYVKYYHPCSDSGKVISIFALLLNLWTPVCLMCSELQRRCHSLSYAGRHLTGCSRNTEKTPCAPPLKLVCAAHEGEK